MPERTMQEHFRGALLGFALGDAVGKPALRLTTEEASALFRDGIQPMVPPQSRVAPWTSCTSLTIEVGESLAACRNADPSDLAQRLVAWLDRGDLRGAGATTLAALRRLKRGTPWQEAGDIGYRSAGAGAAARSLPLILWNCERSGALLREVEEASLITHRHPEAIAAAYGYAVALTAALKGETDGLFTLCARSVKGTDTCRRLKQAEELFRKRRITPRDAMDTIGTSGYAPEAITAALYSFLYFPGNFREAVGASLMAGGETSVIAALTGGLSGAFLGIGELPTDWLATLEERERLDNLAQQLYLLHPREDRVADTQ
jgi:ADP-ribosyl-[dinitrogen reductase] hydrolase